MRWQLVRVTGRSMLPTLHDGDVLLVRRLRPAADPGPLGRLVVVRLPGDRPLAVKRLTGRGPDGGWWVERDSRVEGVDSWTVGELPDDAVHAVVLARVWPRPHRLPDRPR